MNRTAPSAPADLYLAFAALAPQQSHRSPAGIVEADQRRAWRRVAQVEFNVVGLPRGLRVAA